ncbi:hypothetical protein IV203_008098 [Nitzschia inconspicua]|uniref:BZIP domain-containing protein n=1 Tax=Nitzschia inconspicua TaxID=303405 RepID=A0A9K3KZS2_9STRA|nr:hypothetical protein IV203_008098 [Nitzschia inconspicua]
MSNQQQQPHQQQLLSNDLTSAQQEAFDQLASQVQAQVNASTGRPIMFPNPMMPSYLTATHNNMTASLQQQHIPMIWPAPEAGTFPVPMPQLSSSNLLPSGTGMTQYLLGASKSSQPMPVSLSEPVSVSIESTKKVATKKKLNAPVVITSQDDCDDSDAEDDDFKAKHSRERNREHARSTRLRKKAYIQKLKDMAHGLRTVQTEEIRQRRISMQKVLEGQKIRRTVVQKILQYYATYEQDLAKWNVLLEDSFWLKQPVTPFRSFRRSEVERDCRIVRSTEALLCDAASFAVMLERVGCYTNRWKRVKRSDFPHEDLLNKEIMAGRAPESSLSSGSSTDSYNGSQKSQRASAKNNKDLPRDTDSPLKELFSSSDCRNHGSSIKKRRQESSSIPVSSSLDDTVEDNSTPAKRQRPSPSKLATRTVLPAATSAASINGANQPYPTHALSSYNLNLVNQKHRTSASYFMNEDDMIMVEDVMMCPYVFRTSHAVECGSLAEVIVPGMLRVQFSPNNKLLSMEMVFDAMGFMQQLDSANGGNITAQVIPGNLEMALMHCSHEARVITQATPPYSILHVNEVWTGLTEYSQVEVEGKALLPILEGSNMTDSLEEGMMNLGKSSSLLRDAAKGRPSFSTSVHHRKTGKPFVDFMCTYPLTNSNDEITHLLHVNLELPNVETYMP